MPEKLLCLESAIIPWSSSWHTLALPQITCLIPKRGYIRISAICVLYPNPFEALLLLNVDNCDKKGIKPVRQTNLSNPFLPLLINTADSRYDDRIQVPRAFYLRATNERQRTAFSHHSVVLACQRRHLEAATKLLTSSFLHGLCITRLALREFHKPGYSASITLSGFPSINLAGCR